MNVNTLTAGYFFKYNQLTATGKTSAMGGNNAATHFSFEMSRVDFSFQSYTAGFSSGAKVSVSLSDFIDYDAIGYTGKPIEALDPKEAKALVSEEGFFGVKQTAQRIAGFVINGAGEDVERLKEGRRGVIQGFEEAESIWGGKLFDISYETLAKALESIDARIAQLGGSVLDAQA